MQDHKHHIPRSKGLQELMVNTVVLSSNPELLDVQRSSGRVSITPKEGIETSKYMHYSFVVAIIETFSVQKCSTCITSLPFPAITTSRLIMILNLDC